MIEEHNLDFGSIKIHKEAIADITSSALKEIEGVAFPPLRPQDRLLEFFGKKSYSGIKVVIDKDNQISIELKVLVRYGTNIPMIGRQVQEAVRTAVERMAEINLKDIHVNIRGIERGSS